MNKSVVFIYILYVLTSCKRILESSIRSISSANAKTWIPSIQINFSTNSFMNTLKSNGNSEYPCGIPLLSSIAWFVSFILTEVVFSMCLISTYSSEFWSIMFPSFSIKIQWDTLSSLFSSLLSSLFSWRRTSVSYFPVFQQHVYDVVNVQMIS